MEVNGQPHTPTTVPQGKNSHINKADKHVVTGIGLDILSLVAVSEPQIIQHVVGLMVMH
jgi:hypothetical protein